MNPVQLLKFAVENLVNAYRGDAAALKDQDASEVINQSVGQIEQATRAYKEEALEVEKAMAEVLELLDKGEPADKPLERLTKIVQQLDYAQLAYFDVQRKMNGIIREMKEIPELESEQLKDNHPLLKVEFPDKGGVLTFMEGMEHPYKGFPFFEFVDKIDLVKKASRGILSSLYHSLATGSPLYLNNDSGEANHVRPQAKRQRFFRWVLLKTIGGRILKYMIRAEIYTFARFIDRFKIKQNKYSDAVREVYRAYSVVPWGETEEEKHLRLQLRDLFCMYLECDNAYRFRFQDLFPELDKQALRKDPYTELKRVYDIAISRELKREIKDTWVLVKWLIDHYLPSDKAMRKLLINVSCQIDVEKIKLDEADISYCRPRKDYVFKFMKDEKQNV